MGVQGQHWIIDGLRSICVFFDSLIYGLLEWILHTIFDLSNLTASSELLDGVYSRIYVILGIFMAFKLSFSFFQYIVDPESMVGKSEKGVSKLITNTIIMIIALVGLPTILFGSNGGQGMLNRAQNAFLPMLPRLLLGINENSGVAVGGTDDDIADAANVMAMSSLQAFFAPSPELNEVCEDGTYEDTPVIEDMSQFKEYVNLTCKGTDGKNPLYYRYTYIPVISGGVGILMCFILIMIGIDVAIRVFKMIILELIAPIPIMSLIDPKGRKDGAFSHWLKSLISTFLDIFIKLGLLYLVLTLIRLIVTNGLFDNFPSFGDNFLRGAYLTLVLIIALLLFAREAPAFIKDALGLKKDSGGLGYGLGAALGAVGAFGGAVTGGGLTALASGAIAGATADPKVGAFASGRDKAVQIKTGDKNYKGGLVNSLNRWASAHQGESYGKKLGITRDTLAVGKSRVKALAGISEDMSDAYSRFNDNAANVTAADVDALVTSAHGKDALSDFTVSGGILTHGSDTYNLNDDRERRAALYVMATESKKAHDKASGSLDDAKKIASDLGINMSTREKLYMSKRQKDKYNAQHQSQGNIDRTNRIIQNASKRGAYDPGATANSNNVDKF